MCCEIYGARRFSWLPTTGPCIALAPSCRGMTTKIRRRGTSEVSIQKVTKAGMILVWLRVAVLVLTQMGRILRAARLERCMLRGYLGRDVPQPAAASPML